MLDIAKPVGSYAFGSDDNFLTPMQTVTSYMRCRAEFRKVKPSLPNTVSDIPAEHPHMVALAKVDLASCRGRVRTVFLRFIPPLNYRKHKQCKATGSEYAMHLFERLCIVDVFKNVGAHHQVEGLVGEVNVFDV